MTAAKAEITLGELWEDFRINRPRGSGKISQNYEYIWERHFSCWQHKQMSDITYEMAYKMIVTDLRPTAAIHGNRVQRFGKALWNFAIRQRRLQIENHWTFAEYSEKDHKRNAYRLLPTDMPHFKMALEELSDPMRVLFWTTLLTGRRIGECCAMRWTEIDLESGYWGEHSTKTGQQTTTLSPAVCEILREYRDAHQPITQWVFPAHSKAGHVISYNNAWAKVRKQGFNHLNANDLRGTLASWASDLNVPIGVISQQLGHADISTTFNKYVRVSEDTQRLEMDKVGRDILLATTRK
jgi:integrase